MQRAGEGEHTDATGRRVSPFLTTMLALVLILSACADEGPEAELVTANVRPLPDNVAHLSMAIEALEVIDKPGAFVVPSDVSVLALDADALADLATGNGIRDIVASGELVSTIDPSGLGDASVLVRSSGPPFQITSADEGQTMVDGLPFREVVEWGDYQLIVIDGVHGVTEAAAE